MATWKPFFTGNVDSDTLPAPARSLLSALLSTLVFPAAKSLSPVLTVEADVVPAFALGKLGPSLVAQPFIQVLTGMPFLSIVRAFLIEEQKIVKRVLKAQQVEAKKGGKK